MKKTTLAFLLSLCATGVTAQSELYPQHFDLEEVCLLDGPLKTSQDLNIKHLMSYDVDRLLTPFVRLAGLSTTTDTKSRYYRWETKHPNHQNWGGNGFDLSGHVGGHYMTAMALAYAACHDEATKAKIRQRIDYIISVVKDCQDAYNDDKTGLYGFIGGQPMKANWQKLYKGDPDGFWNGAHPVPFYCQHKILAGLRDLAIYTEDDDNFARSTIAKEMFRKMCDWAINVVSKLSDNQVQQILWTEHGGMNETIADAYKLFGEAKYLTGAKRYSDMGMVNGLQSLNTTFLDNRHANTQVPKYVGFARISQVSTSGTSNFKTAATNFWQDVTANRTVCIGGNSVNEHFIAKSAGSRYMDETNGPESCNTNNMLKLTEALFDTYHNSKYSDYYENAMYNHILSTQDPKTGGYVYFTPLRPQSYRIYSKPDQDMWCCVGTGMENHVKYGHFIYTHNDKQTLYVNLFTASTLNSETFALTQQTRFPYQQGTQITIDKDGEFTLAIRKPSWTGEGYGIRINGMEAAFTLKTGYATLENKTWKKGDIVEVTLPMALRYEQCPNMKDYIAFKYGPVLLGARTTKVNSGDKGNLSYEKLNHEYAAGERMGHAPDSYAPKKQLSTMPMLIGQRSDVLSRISPSLNDGEPLVFLLDTRADHEMASGNPWGTMVLQPYYELHHSRVMNYWYQATYETYMKSDWAQAEKEAQRLDERTLDKVDVGQQQAEAGCVFHSDNSSTGSYKDEDYRDTQANGWIELTLNNPDPEARNLAIMLRYTTDDKNRKCKIYVNDVLLKDYTVPNAVPNADANNFYNLELPLRKLAFDADGKIRDKFVVRIVASSTTPNPGLYFVRLVKDNTADEVAYKFRASDWAYTGDGGRISQDKIKVDATANTITMTQTGSNNICLKYGSSNTHEVQLDQKFLVIRGTNLSTTSGKSYLWWLNGKNQGSSVAPTKTSKLADGRVQLVWDISKSGIDDNCKSDPWTLTTSYNAASTTFGLTAATATKEVVISYIGFLNQAQLNGTDEEPQGDMTAIHAPSLLPTSHTTYYTLSGIQYATPQTGINIVHNPNGTVRKIRK
ncbi:MAG: glycoside hydrolase family 127 protein [Bacteroidaceae bacterium]|nr:glycoside hydrolase family 127 protein [Bacteroidaceae bacterium]